ncbi:SDR family NAD(P)-dependent oxidoreductase [Psychroflexus sp. YR1-1]|uniref:SDR family NAD(P)-dependent oxidoreductase n=1 Tax=Psychroflexus aurantiacus TaxID=2709310 RepID=A0A6B3R8V1_9FLAO|nr:SDR family NAD(P)-dependent oxidoreductase [Psychroflexus aurantiacus]NEV93974.1 SDR family NAD(P)-dependent oxidoreductase [Psychroflexus aurantiacus]
MELKDKKVLITGGSAGIGKALIKELLTHGVKDFAVIGRSQDKLNALKDEFKDADFILVSADISRLEAIERLVKEVSKTWDHIDLLINNAGVVSADPLQDMTDEDLVNQININLTGLILLTKKALPLLLKSEDAGLMNMSSGLGYIAKPFYSVYAATKAGVRHFSEAMRRELIFENIHVMTIYPTATDTDMMTSARVDRMDSPELVAQKSIEGLLNKEINVILGGEQRIKDIATNFNHPLEIDKSVRENYEAYKERTKEHRAM